ncbi:MAG: hypothetical protein ACTSUE_04780 [Promethearchaeota archaeon]
MNIRTKISFSKRKFAIFSSILVVFSLFLAGAFPRNRGASIHAEEGGRVFPGGGIGTSDPINYSIAPANLTGIVIDAGVPLDKGLNASMMGFVSEWEYQFDRSLQIHVVDAGLPLGGLPNETAAEAIFNGSLFWWNASFILQGQCTPAISMVNRSEGSLDSLLVEWYNSSMGRGFLMDAGCFDTMQRFTAYHAIILNHGSWWHGQVSNQMRLNIQFNGIGWRQSLSSVESFFKTAVGRQINCIEISRSPLDEISNITLPGFDNHWTAELLAERDAHLSWLGSVTYLAAQYHLKIFLSTDELVMTEPMYDWLNHELDYDGPYYGAEESKRFPDSIKDEAEGAGSPVWTLLEAKYDSLVSILNDTLNATSKAGFGGFKFRIDDISLKNWQGQEVYHKVSFMHTVGTLGRFLNITTAAAATIDAEVVQRTWMLQETENPFNNADVCKQMLDPINATNLILRTKETWNDHWLNHPANPTLGVSHHRWIIGFAVQAITPYYRGFLYDWYAENGTRYNNSGTMVGWWENPNIVGYDSYTITGNKWRTLASSIATEDATVFYLVQHTFNETIRANESVREYLHKVGLFDQGVVENISQIFNLSTEAFRQLFFMKAWSTSGKFRGDVVNGGSDLKFDPVRFNMFYRTLPGYGGMNGVQYTIDEGYNGSKVTHDMADLCPDGYPGYGTLNTSANFIDGTVMTNSTNLTEVLGYFRGHIRAYAAFADMFAEWRAWHIAYYHWLYTWDPASFRLAERARMQVIATHEYFQATYTPAGWGFVYGFNDYSAWNGLVGHSSAARDCLAWVLVASILIFIAMIYSYNWRKSGSAVEPIKVVLGASNWRKRDRDVEFIAPVNESRSAKQITKWIIGTFGIPAGMALGWILLFEGVFAWRLHLLAMPFIMILPGLGIGARIGSGVTQLARRDSRTRLVPAMRSLHASGISMFWQWLCLTVMGLVFLTGGSFIVLLALWSPALITLLVVIFSCAFLAPWTFLRNLKYTGPAHWIASFFIILGCMVAMVLLISLVGGGPASVIEDFIVQLETIA